MNSREAERESTLTMPTALITGIAGFAGSHLAEYLLENAPPDLQLHGITQSGDYANLHRIIEHPRLTLHRFEMENRVALVELMQQVQPNYIFHLAARSFVGAAIRQPELTLNTNVNITLNLLEAVRQAGLAGKTRLLNVGSGDQYGFVTPDDIPVRETTPFRPGNPYAVSKIAQEMLGYQYFRSYKIHVVNVRPFNQLGARLSTELAAGAFAQQIALAEAGKVPPLIRHGNLESSRDFTDVRDMVRAYWLALSPEFSCQPGEVYNLCSGVDRKIQTILDKLIGLARCELNVEIDPDRMRPSDVPVVRGDFSKFEAATGWRPEIGLDESLRELLDYWREQVNQG
jgi:GDP-4-dehydro-6-deoxy-D-mannose reductase